MSQPAKSFEERAALDGYYRPPLRALWTSDRTPTDRSTLPSFDAKTLDWCLQVGEIVLRSPEARHAQSPNDALERYVAGVDGGVADLAAPPLFHSSADEPPLTMTQRLERLGILINKPRAVVIDWAARIGVEVLSDPEANRNASPEDALAALVLRAYVARRGNGAASS